MEREILVTGMGIIAGPGNGKEAIYKALKECHSAIKPIEYLNTIHHHLPAGEVPFTNEEMCRLLEIGEEEICTRTALLGRVALREAIREAKIGEKTKRIAFISGTTVGGMDKSEQYYSDFLANDEKNSYIESHDCGATTALIAQEFSGKFSIITTISTACSSAANALILGANLIKTGRADIAIVGGSESLSKFHFNGFNTLMILDKSQCKPFDKLRAGINLGEGAAYLVLESEESAKARDVAPICKVSGYGNACDAFHQTATSPQGDGPFLAMEKALQNCKLSPKEIGYVNAHGTGTDNNDLTEGIAIQRLFGNAVPPVSSTKAFTGHTTSAAGSVESVISILALTRNFIPVNLNFTFPIEELDFMPVKEEKGKVDIQHVLTNSFGFGGNDSAVVFSKL